MKAMMRTKKKVSSFVRVNKRTGHDWVPRLDRSISIPCCIILLSKFKKYLPRCVVQMIHLPAAEEGCLSLSKPSHKPLPFDPHLSSLLFTPLFPLPSRSFPFTNSQTHKLTINPNPTQHQKHIHTSLPIFPPPPSSPFSLSPKPPNTSQRQKPAKLPTYIHFHLPQDIKSIRYPLPSPIVCPVRFSYHIEHRP